MTTRWRLLDCGPGAGDWNMALDQALLEALAVGHRRSALRFYCWEAPTLSLGRLQRPPSELLAGCRELGVAVVRRPTGGKAILHHHELTFSIIAPAAGLGSVMQSYCAFARAIAAGLRGMGVEASICRASASARDAALLCFAHPAGCDLQVSGRKLVGSAQARRAGALLQQNSLPLTLSHEIKARLFGPAAEGEARVATDLSRALGRQPSLAEVREAIIAGFEAELGMKLERDRPTSAETAAAQKLRARFTL